MAHDVFISYGTQDRIVAEGLCAFLEERGIICWIAPRNIETGNNYAGAITRALRVAKTVIVICSRSSCRSEHVKSEVTLAFNQNKRILPFCIEENPFDDDLEYFLSSKQQIRTCGNHEKDFAEIAGIIGEKSIPDTSQVRQETKVKKSKIRPVSILVLALLCVAIISVILFRSFGNIPESNISHPLLETDTFTGNIINGHPDGLGTYVFARPRRIDQHDPSERMAAPGDSIRGNWTNGHLNYGEWYDAKGNKKEFIQLGDHPDKEADWQLGTCGKP